MVLRLNIYVLSLDDTMLLSAQTGLLGCTIGKDALFHNLPSSMHFDLALCPKDPPHMPHPISQYFRLCESATLTNGVS